MELTWDRAKRSLRRASTAADEHAINFSLDVLSATAVNAHIDGAEENAMIQILAPFFLPTPRRNITSALDVTISLTLRSATFSKKLCSSGCFEALIRHFKDNGSRLPPSTISAILVLCGNVLLDTSFKLDVDWAAILAPRIARWRMNLEHFQEPLRNVVFFASVLADLHRRQTNRCAPAQTWEFLVGVFLMPDRDLWDHGTWIESSQGLRYVLVTHGRPAADYIMNHGFLDDAFGRFVLNPDVHSFGLFALMVAFVSDVGLLLRHVWPSLVVSALLEHYHSEEKYCAYLCCRHVRRIDRLLRRRGFDPFPTLRAALTFMIDNFPDHASSFHHIAGIPRMSLHVQLNETNRAARAARAMAAIWRAGHAFFRVIGVLWHSTPTFNQRKLFFSSV